MSPTGNPERTFGGVSAEQMNGSGVLPASGACGPARCLARWFRTKPELTLNADTHPSMNRMHTPGLDLKTWRPLPPVQQDRRSLVLLEVTDFERRFAGTLEEAKGLDQMTPVELSTRAHRHSPLPNKRNTFCCACSLARRWTTLTDWHRYRHQQWPPLQSPHNWW